MPKFLGLQKADDLGKELPQTVFVTAAATIKPYQTDIRITTGASVAYDITMPSIDTVPVGTSYYGRVISDGGTGDVTIKDAAGTDILGDALSAANDHFKITNHIGVWKVDYEVTT